jgi:hypothetical protein
MSFSKPDYRSRLLWRAGFATICLLSAYLLLSAVLLTKIDQPIRADARNYVAYAYNLRAHGIYSRDLPVEGVQPKPDAVSAPGYPFFLTNFMEPSGKFDMLGVLLAQALLSIGTVVVYLYLYRRFLRFELALLAGIFTAISPHLINASVYLLSETLFTFLLGAHVLALAHCLNKKKLFAAIIAGVLLAFSLLVRPTSQYLILAYLAFFAFFFGKDWRDHRKMLLVLILPVVLVSGIWSARNWAETGRPSDPTLSANFLQHGMYINMMYQDQQASYGYPYRFDPQNNELSGHTDRILQAMLKQFEAEPTRYVSWFLFGKPDLPPSGVPNQSRKSEIARLIDLAAG